MINVTRLLCDKPTPGDFLRYPKNILARKPIVVWNCTRKCNLKCVHCYSESSSCDYEGELSTIEAKEMINDLAYFGVPVLLFSGGEPLLRNDIYELGAYANSLGIRPVISTNGTLINSANSRKIKEAGFVYVGISLDGISYTNDKFRGVNGAFDAAVKGFEYCICIGQKVGLRLTMTKANVADMPAIFDFIEESGIPRACFYHLVYSGRGSSILESDLTHSQTRNAVELIMQHTVDFHLHGLDKDILTVDNHCDGVLIYLNLLKSNPEQAKKVLNLLKLNGGNSSGMGIACIDNIGDVHPDQFWRSKTFGNVRNRKFSEIWMDISDPIMAGLKNRKPLLKGRCSKESCKWIDICNGNFRARALAVFNDPWMQDPACYLSDSECSEFCIQDALEICR